MRSFPFRRRKESSLEASKPYIWQEDERRVRDGSCHFSVKVIFVSVKVVINVKYIKLCLCLDSHAYRLIYPYFL